MMMQGGGQVNQSGTVSLRCPECRQMGTFHPFMQHDAGTQRGGRACIAGLRLCPNQSCRALVFCVWNQAGGKLVASYPPERLDFDATNIPASITKALEEAITCHANECFIASAIMVRKTLEELCHERGATGANLKERLRNLGTKAYSLQSCSTVSTICVCLGTTRRTLSRRSLIRSDRKKSKSAFSLQKRC